MSPGADPLQTFAKLHDRFRALHDDLHSSVADRIAVRDELRQLTRRIPAADLAAAPEALRRTVQRFARDAARERTAGAGRERG